MDFSELYPDTASTVSLAARRGDIAALRVLKEAGKACNTRDNRGWYPIHEAAYWSNSECLLFLLQWDEVNVNWSTFEGETALWLATKNEDLEVVEILLRAGSSVNFGNNENVLPLHLAAAKGNVKLAEVLVLHGANVNAQDFNLYTAVQEAALIGCTELVRLLLERGANPNLIDEHGRTALFCATEKHKCEIVDLIAPYMSLEKLNLRAADGTTCLMLAARAGCKNCVDFFLKKGNDVNAVTEDGCMALHFSVLSPNIQLFQQLLKLTDLCILKNTEKTTNIVELAIQEQRYEHLQLLRAAGIQFSDFLINYPHIHHPIPPLAYFLYTDGAATSQGVTFFNSCIPAELRPPGTLLRALIRNWNRIPESLRTSYLKHLAESYGQSLASELSDIVPDADSNFTGVPTDFVLKVLQHGLHLEPKFENLVQKHCPGSGSVRRLQDICRSALRFQLYQTGLRTSLVPVFNELPVPAGLKLFLNYHTV